MNAKKRKRKRVTNHLVIGDPHAKPGVSNDRFDWIGRLVLDRRPDVIICTGDMADMVSLSSYDKGKKSHEGRRYKLDVDVVRDALVRFDAPLASYNEQCRRNRKAQYRPRKIMTLGNHEDRIDRAINLSPELAGAISMEDLGYEEHGWEVVPYKEHIEVDGVFYSHFFASGNMGEPIGGVNIGASLLAKHMASCTVGHDHRFDHATRCLPNGRRVNGLSAGCFTVEDPDYAVNTSYTWWRGAVMCSNVQDGEYDLEQISLETIKKLYGKEITHND